MPVVLTSEPIINKSTSRYCTWLLGDVGDLDINDCIYDYHFCGADEIISKYDIGKACLIYDNQEKKLTVIVGKFYKNLFVKKISGKLYISDAVWRFHDVESEIMINTNQFSSALARIAPASSDIIYKGYTRVSTGQVATISDSGVRIKDYWRYYDIKKRKKKSSDVEIFNHCKKILETELTRLSNKYSVASELSGGIDSSSITCLMANLFKQQNITLKSYAVMPEKNYCHPYSHKNISYNERHYLSLIEKKYSNVDIVIFNERPHDIFEFCKVWVKKCDHPFYAVDNLYWLKSNIDQASKDTVDVLLSGHLGNDTLSYRGVNKTLRSQLGLFKRYLLKLVGKKYDIVHRIIIENNLIKNSFLKNNAESWVDNIQGMNFSDRMVNASKKGLVDNYYPFGLIDYWLNEKNVRLEYPLYCHELVDFSYSLKNKYFYRGGEFKFLAKGAMKNIVPDEILYRKTIGAQSVTWAKNYYYFPTMIDRWLEYVETSLINRYVFDVKAISKFAEQANLVISDYLLGLSADPVHDEVLYKCFFSHLIFITVWLHEQFNERFVNIGPEVFS